MTVHRISSQPASLLDQIRELRGARELFLVLFGRDVRVRYKQTALGVVWVVLQPLVPALIFAAVFGSFARLPSQGSPYLLFALTGLVLFGLFSNAVSRAGTSFLRDGNLLTKVYFPRAVLPLASGSASVIDFLVGSGVLFVVMLGTGTAPTLALVLGAAVAFLTLVLGLSLGLALAALTAHYRDFAIAMPFAIQVLLYASPVVYSSELVPAPWGSLYALNPLVSLIEGFRWAVIGTPAPSWERFATGAVVGMGLVLVSLFAFGRASRDLTDIV